MKTVVFQGQKKVGLLTICPKKSSTTKHTKHTKKRVRGCVARARQHDSRTTACHGNFTPAESRHLSCVSWFPSDLPRKSPWKTKKRLRMRRRCFARLPMMSTKGKAPPRHRAQPVHENGAVERPRNENSTEGIRADCLVLSRALSALLKWTMVGRRPPKAVLPHPTTNPMAE
jgi:hypothetical protein